MFDGRAGLAPLGCAGPSLLRCPVAHVFWVWPQTSSHVDWAAEDPASASQSIREVGFDPVGPRLDRRVFQPLAAGGSDYLAAPNQADQSPARRSDLEDCRPRPHQLLPKSCVGSTAVRLERKSVTSRWQVIRHPRPAFPECLVD
jgi:hypothetical protein